MSNWYESQKAAGAELIVHWYERKKTWRKKFSQDGKAKYFKHPNSKAGYEAACRDWFEFQNSLNAARKWAGLYQHHIDKFEQVKRWYEIFGVPVSERRLADQVSAFIQWLTDLVAQKELSDSIPIGGFCLLPQKRPEFYTEFAKENRSLGQTDKYELPAKWLDRIDRANTEIVDKENQTIGYWIDKYIARVKVRGGKFITKKSARDRKYKLQHFSEYCDKLAHIAVIDEAYMEKYHHELDGAASLEMDTKKDYFAVFRMFVRWCSQQRSCDLQPPANLDSKEFGFREAMGLGRKRMQKKSILWTPEEFNALLQSVPTDKQCFFMLMLNCGFRHVDLGELRKTDIDLEQGRLIIQRNKLNQQATAPVINYKLWKRTVALMAKTMADDPVYAFRNARGGSVEDALKTWWKRWAKANPKHIAAGKRLDYLRKTGSTTVAKYDRMLDTWYLGECLDQTSKISYSFEDGEQNDTFDEALDFLGHQFGFAKSATKTIRATPEMIEALRTMGHSV